MAGRSEETPRDTSSESPNEQRYKDLARQNREGHRQVERTLKEAEQIANASRGSAAPA
jgi:hypothetical protein